MVNGTAASHLAVESADMPHFGRPGLKKKACTYRKCISISLSQQLAYNECDSGNYISLISNINARNLRPHKLEEKTSSWQKGRCGPGTCTGMLFLQLEYHSCNNGLLTSSL